MELAFQFETKAWYDKCGQFRGEIKFTEMDESLVGIGMLGSFNGWDIYSDDSPDVDLDHEIIFLPGRKGGLNDPFEITDVETYHSVVAALFDAQKGLGINSLSKSVNESAYAMVNSLDTTIGHIEKAKKKLEELKRDIKQKPNISCPVDRLFAIKRAIQAVLLESLMLGAACCPFCRHHSGDCGKCEYAKHSGMACSHPDADWARLLELVKETKQLTQRVYRNIGM